MIERLSADVETYATAVDLHGGDHPESNVRASSDTTTVPPLPTLEIVSPECSNETQQRLQQSSAEFQTQMEYQSRESASNNTIADLAKQYLANGLLLELRDLFEMNRLHVNLRAEIQVKAALRECGEVEASFSDGRLRLRKIHCRHEFGEEGVNMWIDAEGAVWSQRYEVRHEPASNDRAEAVKQLRNYSAFAR